MRFTLVIDCDNAAFGEGLASMERELGTCLDMLARKLKHGGYSLTEPGRVIDSNGNTVGRFGFEESK